MNDRKKKYYEKNKQRILRGLKKKRQVEKLKRLEKSETDFQPRTLFSEFFKPTNFEKFLIGILVFLCTLFLIWESTLTLSVIEGQGAIWKAILCELILVGVSFVKATSFSQKIFRGFLISGISALALLNALGGPIRHFSEASRGVVAKTQEVELLEATIEKKNVLLKKYLETDRISGARKLEGELSQAQDRLSELRQALSESKSLFDLRLGLIFAVLFRVVVMAANIYFASRLSHEVKQSSFVSTRPKLRLVAT